ncbi:hypothetical protein [Sphingobacterium sp. UBA2096]|uniref:hypothetical protein n=1 Tax=Sphingobacterium sp. UBA2096 TaxID=1947488 RepID=UPI00257B5330|nr:hypothetical protein [Sphingobacterium sp. UBA2096]
MKTLPLKLNEYIVIKEYGYPFVIGKSEYTTFGNLECSKNGTNGAAFLAIRNAA